LQWNGEATKEFHWMESCTEIYWQGIVDVANKGMDEWPPDGYWWFDDNEQMSMDQAVFESMNQPVTGASFWNFSTNFSDCDEDDGPNP